MTLFDHLVNRLLGGHPLPWRVDYDWSVEVYDAKNVIVMSFPDAALAAELMEAATARHADNQQRAVKFAAFLRENGIEP